MGGRGTGFKQGGAGGGGKISQAALKSAAQDYVAHHLRAGETYASVDSAEIVGPISEDGYADVEVRYHTDVQIYLGNDPETGVPEYEYDSEYSRDVYRLKVR